MFTIVESITIMASTSDRTKRVRICCRSILLESTGPESVDLFSVAATVQPILWRIVVSADSNRIYDFLPRQELAMCRDNSLIKWELVA